MIKDRKVGLALSGGGFRAAAFHLGTLKKLNELGILNNLDVISTISGGSIVGAFYALNKDNFESFANDFRNVLKKNLVLRACFSISFIIRVILLLSTIYVFCRITENASWTVVYTIFLLVIVGCFFYKIFPTTKLIRNLYNSLIYKGKRLKDLPEKPEIIINSTNLDTGTLFSFTREYSFDSSYKYPPYNINPIFTTGDFTIALAVSCSSSVPYGFSPTILKFKCSDKSVVPRLMDGGVYDNQGIYRLTESSQKYKTDIVIVSDASSPFNKKYFGINPIPVFRRMMEVMMRRIRNAQFMQSIYEDDEEQIWEIGYYSLEWNYENCLTGFYNAAKKKNIRKHLLSYHKITEEMITDKTLVIEHLKKSTGFENIIDKGLNEDEIEFVKKISTSLKSLTDNEINLLCKHSEVLTEIQVKLYCPSLTA